MSTLPLFPLSSIVMPDGRIPLRLFERRYLDMVTNALKTETGFGICLIRDGQEAGAPAEPYNMGTHAKVVDFDQGTDGLLHIVVQGIEEFDLHRFDITDAGLLMGEVTFVQRPRSATEVDYSELAHKLDLILRFVEPRIEYAEKRLDDAEWVTNRLLELLPLEAADKFELLELRSLEARLAALIELPFRVESVSGPST